MLLWKLPWKTFLLNVWPNDSSRYVQVCAGLVLDLASSKSKLLEGVSQMDSIPPGRVLALVRPGNDLGLRRIRNLKRCVQHLRVAGLDGHHRQPVIGRLPLQHAQGSLLLTRELRRLCRRCLCRRCLCWWCLRWWCLNQGGSRLGGHVLLRFVLAARRPAPLFRLQRLRRSVRPARSVLRRSVLLRLRRPVVFGRLHPFLLYVVKI